MQHHLPTTKISGATRTVPRATEIRMVHIINKTKKPTRTPDIVVCSMDQCSNHTRASRHVRVQTAFSPETLRVAPARGLAHPCHGGIAGRRMLTDAERTASNKGLPPLLISERSCSISTSNGTPLASWLSSWPMRWRQPPCSSSCAAVALSAGAIGNPREYHSRAVAQSNISLKKLRCQVAPPSHLRTHVLLSRVCVHPATTTRARANLHKKGRGRHLKRSETLVGVDHMYETVDSEEARSAREHQSVCAYAGSRHPVGRRMPMPEQTTRGVNAHVQIRSGLAQPPPTTLTRHFSRVPDRLPQREVSPAHRSVHAARRALLLLMVVVLRLVLRHTREGEGGGVTLRTLWPCAHCRTNSEFSSQAHAFHKWPSAVGTGRRLRTPAPSSFTAARKGSTSASHSPRI